MIYYNPTDNDVLTNWIKYNPRSVFIMTQLGGEISIKLNNIISDIKSVLGKYHIRDFDANSFITGRDFHTKIWKIALSVPIGLAVVSETMKPTTIANIYYEIGLMNALGKETLVIKTDKFTIPSDFIRTEYIEYNNNFSYRFEKFINQTFDQAEYYGLIAENLIAKPLLTIDYLRRAYLISGDIAYKKRAQDIMLSNDFDEHILLMYKSYFDIQN